MRTLSLAVTEKQYAKYAVLQKELTLDVLIKEIKKDLAKEALRKCREIARKAGISNMTMDEINAEIAAYRKERKAKRDAKASA